MNKNNVVINDRVKLAEAMVAKGLIKSGDDHYKEIIDHNRTTERYILEKARYYKVELGVKNEQ